MPGDIGQTFLSQEVKGKERGPALEDKESRTRLGTREREPVLQSSAQVLSIAPAEVACPGLLRP